MRYEKPTRIWMRSHSEFNERWLQDRIAEDPSILGLGELILKDRERPQPRAGRLDLLLQDTDSTRRYEVEIQLGKTDEAHIIRSIEYWDIERKRYPQYDHVAVIVAEDITSRFLNVVSLFNGFIPLVAIQVGAFAVGEAVSLMSTIVLDQLQLGLVDDDEESEVTDRSFWETRASKATLGMADEVLEMIHELDPELQLKFNKFYIGLARDGQPQNFVIFRPKKEHLRIEPRLERSDELEKTLEDAGLDLMDYDTRWKRYRFRISRGQLKEHKAVIKDLLQTAWDAANA